jgi:transposase
MVDLLADRSAETTRTWLQAHLEIEVVSRDRGKEYIAAATNGAPQAKQVADRFHVMRKSVGSGATPARTRAHRDQDKQQRAISTDRREPPTRSVSS